MTVATPPGVEQNPAYGPACGFFSLSKSATEEAWLQRQVNDPIAPLFRLRGRPDQDKAFGDGPVRIRSTGEPQILDPGQFQRGFGATGRQDKTMAEILIGEESRSGQGVASGLEVVLRRDRRLLSKEP